MTSGDPAPADRAGKHKDRPAERRTAAAEPAGPAWIVLPLRVVATIVIFPFRLLYDLVRLIGRGLGRVFGGIWNAVYRWVLAPIGRAVATTLYYLIAVPAKWIYRVLLTPVGHAIVAVLRWIYRALLTPLGHAIVAVVRWIGWLLGVALVRPLAWLLNILIVIPAVFLWKYVLYPPLTWLGRALAALGRGLAWTWRVLVVVPWRYAAQVLRWLWRTFVAIPCGWLWRNVLRPIGRGIGTVWNVCVAAPYRVVRQTLRDVRLQLRRMFRGA